MKSKTQRATSNPAAGTGEDDAHGSLQGKISMLETENAHLKARITDLEAFIQRRFKAQTQEEFDASLEYVEGP
jgi:hypothetical protein